MKGYRHSYSIMTFTIRERAKCAVWYDSMQSVVSVQRKFRTEFDKGRHDAIPSGDSIKRWHKSLMTNGTVLNAHHHRTQTRRSDEDVAAVQEHFKENPHSSTRRASLTLDMSRTTVRRVLKDLNWYPYKVHVVQALSEEDFASRLDFATEELRRISENPLRLSSLAFSDEAHFYLDGGVNRHNHRYWAPENPCWVTEHSLHPEKTTVWAVICTEALIGPFFFDQTVNGERYLSMLQQQFWPEVKRLGLKNTMIFMQDGAPPHWSREVRKWLDIKFPNRWMGRGGPMRWPARSPDLTPCDFFLWGFLKSKVYATRPRDIADLKQRIVSAFKEVTADMRQKTLHEYRNRLNKVVETDGHHVEVRTS